MSVDVRDEADPDAETITVTESDGWFVARDETTGVASQGRTKAEAIANLADAIELHGQPVPEDADEDPEPSDAPWF